MLVLTNKSSAVAEMGDHLATIDIGQKVETAVPLSLGGSWVPMKYNVAWAEAYLRTKWRLDPSNRWAIIHQRYRQKGQWSHSTWRTITCNGRPKTGKKNATRTQQPRQPPFNHVLSRFSSFTCSARELLGINGTGFFTGRTSVLSPNQQCQNTERNTEH